MPRRLSTVILALFVFLTAYTVGAQTTAFNFQGRLNDGSSAANGRYDLQFKLFDAINGGNQISSTVDRPNLTLINGVFSTTLDFGETPFNGTIRFLEISVRPNGSSNPHVVLGGRQQILSVPFSIRAKSAEFATFAGQADNATHATIADNATSSQNAVNATNAINATTASNAVTAQNALTLGGVGSNGYAKLNAANTGELITDGNIRQGLGAGGTVKAMVSIQNDFLNNPQIVRCYNGLTGATSGNCGFTASSNLPGVYQINLGFEVGNRFVSAIPRYDTGGSSVANNPGIAYGFPSANPTVVEIYTFENGNPDDTHDYDFMLILY